LVIGHYSARYEDMAPLKKEADKIFPGTILGEEGMRLSV
jgi:ribonuclease Z